MLEKKIEKELKSYMQQAGGVCHEFISPGNNGMPDRLCIFPDGRLVFVELKRPKSGSLSKVQVEQLQRLSKLKQDVYVIWNFDDLSEFFNGLGYDDISKAIDCKYEL